MAMTDVKQVAKQKERVGSKPVKTPPLRVVSKTELIKRQDRRRIRRTLLLAGFLAAIAIFGTVAARGVLAERQIQLDKLNTQLSAQQAKHQELDYKLAQLESPSAVVNNAENNLGMTTPSNITYLRPANTTSSSAP